MSDTTVNSMNLHLQKPDTKYDLRLSTGLKDALKNTAERKGMDMADYARLAFNNQIEEDTAVPE